MWRGPQYNFPPSVSPTAKAPPLSRAVGGACAMQGQGSGNELSDSGKGAPSRQLNSAPPCPCSNAGAAIVAGSAHSTACPAGGCWPGASSPERRCKGRRVSPLSRVDVVGEARVLGCDAITSSTCSSSSHTSDRRTTAPAKKLVTEVGCRMPCSSSAPSSLLSAAPHQSPSAALNTATLPSDSSAASLSQPSDEWVPAKKDTDTAGAGQAATTEHMGGGTASCCRGVTSTLAPSMTATVPEEAAV
mmetsp:Transcript_18218/g.54805  ORF Transcript_18218/g.54805 Transcript_18218/m.54805 type:complete len:245 (-) Transcript_18218:518-1252(-)